jgi:hypothetical protein
LLLFILLLYFEMSCKGSKLDGVSGCNVSQSNRGSKNQMQRSNCQKEGIDQYVVLEGEGVVLVCLLLLLPTLNRSPSSDSESWNSLDSCSTLAQKSSRLGRGISSKA